MKLEGVFKKMSSQNKKPVEYFLLLGDDLLCLNQLIGRKIKIKHSFNQCLHCQKDLPIYRMGYCKTCFFLVPQTNESILRPELSTAHMGIEQRDLAFEKELELQPHIVYLAVSSGLKVGVTRKSQTPTRWIDQGASFALPILECENRYQAGITEVALAQHVADKTNYRKMLTGDIPQLDLVLERDKIREFIPKETAHFFLEKEEIQYFVYPLPNLDKITSLSLDKNPEIEKTLLGIKGQYLVFDDFTALNVRSFEGYGVEVEVG
ncbi:MAG: DUF2797 domain-containing protein [Flavobacteriaceae bacterium]|nr:MAG: DUF2797 domain-containing protein [Flavobacteriaceae bacterium]